MRRVERCDCIVLRTPKDGLHLADGAVENVGSTATAGAFHLGGRADVLFLRARGSDMALGPYLDVATSSFRNLDAGGGAEWLVPMVADEFPFVLSAGAFFRNGDGRAWTPGVEGSLFFGSRSYNFHSVYGLAAGLFAQTRWVPSSPASVDLVFGVQIDAELIALPFLFVYEALTH